jgi:hypothetical protein
MKQKIDIKPIEDNYKSRFQRIRDCQSEDYYFKNCKFSIWQYFQIKGWFELLVNNNVEQSKQAFYDAAKTDIYYYQLFKENVSDLFAAGRTHVLETSLSDNKSVMNEYAKIDYKLRKYGRKLVWHSDMVKEGKGHIYCDLINRAMNRDYSLLNKSIKIAKEKSLNLKKNQWMHLDLEFFDGILNKKKDKVFKAINQLCTKEHKKRNKHSFFFKDIISHPAQGYLKISWINEIEIEVNNKYIHNELIPISPNKKYDDNAKILIEKMNVSEPPKNYNGWKVKP